MLTQGRDGTLKCWRTSGGSDGGDPPTPPRAPPSWTLSSGSYHYCKFATRESAGYDGTMGALVTVAGETQSALDVCEMPSLNDDDDDDDDDADADADTPRMGAPRRLACLIAAADREHASAPSRVSPQNPSESESRDRLGVVMAVAFLPTRGGRVALLAAHEEGTVCLWHLGDRRACDEPTNERIDEPLWRTRAHGDAATCLAADERGDGFVSGGADGACVRFRVAWGDDDVASGDGTLVGTQVGTRVTVETVRTHGPFAPRNPNVDAAGDVRALRGVAAVAVRDDCKIFAAGYWDGRVRLFEYGARSSGRKLASLGYHEHAATCVAFAPTHSPRGVLWAGHAGWLASGSRDGTVAMWAVYPPKEEPAAKGGCEGDGDDG